MLVWIPTTINGQPLTLNSIGQFVKAKSFPENNDGYRNYWSEAKNQIGDKTIDQAGWVLMTKDVLLGSRNKNYIYQKQMVEQCSEYEVPNALEVAFCIFAKYYSSDIRVYSDQPWTFTCCHEKVGNRQVSVGGFLAPYGLSVCFSYGHGCFGIAALRKFFLGHRS